MNQWLLITLFYLLGSLVLVSELFLPAHGMLGMLGVGMLAFGLYETFQISQVAGIIGMVVLAVILPTFLIISVRTWHRTPIGRRISPPNPTLTAQDRLPVERLEALVGKTGRALTPLRPVGSCEFDGRRVECMAEYGMIAVDTQVQAIGVVDRTLSVRPVRPAAEALHA